MQIDEEYLTALKCKLGISV